MRLTVDYIFFCYCPIALIIGYILFEIIIRLIDQTENKEILPSKAIREQEEKYKPVKVLTNFVNFDEIDNSFSDADRKRDFEQFEASFFRHLSRHLSDENYEYKQVKVLSNYTPYFDYEEYLNKLDDEDDKEYLTDYERYLLRDEEDKRFSRGRYAPDND